jgi:glutaredoxin-like protein NrdH
MKTRTITVYSKPRCVQCDATKRWLDKRSIQYTLIDITESPADAEAVKALGFQQAPVVIVSTGDPETDLMWSGFEINNLNKYVHTTTEEAA